MTDGWIKSEIKILTIWLIKIKQNEFEFPDFVTDGSFGFSPSKDDRIKSFDLLEAFQTFGISEKR